MSFLQRLHHFIWPPDRQYDLFWRWFQRNQKVFFNIVQQRQRVEEDFFNRLSPRLNKIRSGYYYSSGRYDKETVELIITADGNIKNIVFVEELVKAAPLINGWRFTALKPPSKISDVGISIGGVAFNSENISFFANEHAAFPDKIDITLVHHDMLTGDREAVATGMQIFLENYIGELEYVNSIDQMRIVGKAGATQELIPISSLKAYLAWRQLEFVEKYDRIYYASEKDEYDMLTAELTGGDHLVALVNRSLLYWEDKPSHPWIATMTIRYDGSRSNKMPGRRDIRLLDKIEKAIGSMLTEKEGYVNVGRQTAMEQRSIFFACREFRKCSKVMDDIKRQFEHQFAIEYDIIKDKYWQCFDRFKHN